MHDFRKNFNDLCNRVTNWGQIILKNGNLLIAQHSGQSRDLLLIVECEPRCVFLTVGYVWKAGVWVFLKQSGGMVSNHGSPHNEGIPEHSSNAQFDGDCLVETEASLVY